MTSQKADCAYQASQQASLELSSGRREHVHVVLVNINWRHWFRSSWLLWGSASGHLAGMLW